MLLHTMSLKEEEEENRTNFKEHLEKIEMKLL